ncbi:MAG: DUF6625 family protein [Planctomycetaceae bacterium]
MSDARRDTTGRAGGAAGRRVALVVVWRGPFPSYFDLFLASCAANPEITWLILGDHADHAAAPANVRFLPLSVDDMNRRIRDALGVETRITWTYKYCDLKPMYGLLFADHLRDFTHWGHCDLDIIWGRFADFLTDDLFDRHPRVQEKGHLAIFRNDDEGSRLFMLEAPGIVDWRTVLAHENYYFFFDESAGINRILEHHGVPRAPVAPVADVLAPPARFRLYGHANHRLQAFFWNDGRVFRDFVDDATGRIGRDEFLYIHLQKRRLPAPEFRAIPDLGYWITPHGFFPRLSAEPDRRTIRRMNRPSWRHRAFVVRWRAGNLWRKLTGANRPPIGSVVRHDSR